MSTSRGGGGGAFCSCLFSALALLAGHILSNASSFASATTIGINYGQVADNLPAPEEVLSLLQANNISKIKLYSVNATVCKAFANSGIELIVGMGNEYVGNMTNPDHATEWVQENIQAYLPATKITGIAVGNEVLTGTDKQLIANLVPAMKNIHSALQNIGIDMNITVTTPHSLAVLGNSFPPSSGSFTPDVTTTMKPLLNFLSQIGAPFFINAYPYFAYKDSPGQVSLQYVLFEPNAGVVDPSNNAHYDNMLYAQIDAVYSALSALGYSNVEVTVSETGWPSEGDSNEAGATAQNAQIYNGNLIQRLAQNERTPLRPKLDVKAYIFALFNEDMKPGPASERNYGLFKPDGSPTYSVGLVGSLRASSSPLNATPLAFSPTESNNPYSVYSAVAVVVVACALRLSSLRFNSRVTAARVEMEGLDEEKHSLSRINMDYAPARRRVRNAFVQIQQNLDHCLFKMVKSGVKTEERYEINSRGLEIFSKSWLPEFGPLKAIIFFCHGYGDTCTFFFEGVAKKLAASGYGVFAMDYPGFGLSEGLHCYIPSFDRLVDDVIEHYSKIRAMSDYKDLPCFLFGQSLGGAVALKIHLKQPHVWDGAVLVAPMCKIADDVTPPWPLVQILLVIAHIFPTKKLVPQKDLAELAFRDIKKRKLAAYNVIAYKDRPRLRTAVEMLRTTQEIDKIMHEVSLPLLILHGAADVMTDPSVSKALYEKSKSADKQLKIYENAYHAILEGESDESIFQVLDDIVSWLDAHCTVRQSRQ